MQASSRFHNFSRSTPLLHPHYSKIDIFLEIFSPVISLTASLIQPYPDQLFNFGSILILLFYPTPTICRKFWQYCWNQGLKYQRWGPSSVSCVYPKKAPLRGVGGLKNLLWGCYRARRRYKKLGVVRWVAQYGLAALSWRRGLKSWSGFVSGSNFEYFWRRS